MLRGSSSGIDSFFEAPCKRRLEATHTAALHMLQPGRREDRSALAPPVHVGKGTAMSMLSTRFSRALNLRYPIVSAPMAFAGGGALAAAVTRAGGLGLIGGGYGDPSWLEAQFDAADDQRVGVGFITWSLRKSPSLLTDVLERKPAAVMLSFGDPRPFVDDIRRAGAILICQCQDMAHVQDALDAGADVVVAQGAEAGGHGALRGTFSFVPEAADYLVGHSPDTLLLAAGGIADGRGLAAALMLGADGVLVGTRFWASSEALVKQAHHQAIIESNGDDTLRTTVADIARQIAWPRGFTARIRRNVFTDRWHGREEALERNIAVEGPCYRRAFSEGDPDNTGVWFGEAAGLIHAIEPAGAIVERMGAEAVVQLARQGDEART
jgi:nitronate monooxygenase